jgi:uncharacterized protein YbjT (DUF2867 family)
MKILLTGATGYVGKRLLPLLLSVGFHVVCCVRDKNRFHYEGNNVQNLEVIEVDFLIEETLKNIPIDIDGAYYLMHSMSMQTDYKVLELLSAKNFREKMNETQVRHVIYLSGIVNEKSLSVHLSSRKAVEDELSKGNYAFTALRAGIIIGSGSASFEIIRDLVEKLPIMITPKWLNTKCQPIGIADVINILFKSIFNEKTFDRDFDIGGPDILSYKEMLLQFAKVRQLKRKIFVVPVMTPKLSSYWLYFVTSTSYKLATALVDSMKVEVVCRNNSINEILEIKPISYEAALKNAFAKIETNEIISSWKDSMVSGRFNMNLSSFIQVPVFGCYIDKREKRVINTDKTLAKIWEIGGEVGWYYADFLWQIRGFIDKLAGGVGLRRGRSNPKLINAGDSIDFWRVLYADKAEKRLLLFAEMKLPGDAWLEFVIKDDFLIQTATFRPKGLWGRLYWFSVYPFHGLIFNGMLNKLTK